MPKWLSRERQVFVYDLAAGDLLENFLVAAIVALVGVRLLLAVTGYPQVGGSHLHIAHMLWGGLLMFLALVIAMLFVNKEAKMLTSIVGGFGFGLFIDELGKFITRDNNYFFQPAMAMIYLVFIGLFLFIREGFHHFHFSAKEYAVNAAEVLKEVIVQDLDDNEKAKALDLLQKSGLNNPIVASLHALLVDIEPDRTPGRLNRVSRRLLSGYRHIVHDNRFITVVVSLFGCSSMLVLIKAIFYVFRWVVLDNPVHAARVSWAVWGYNIGSYTVSFLVVIGLVELLVRKSRKRAFEFYKYALLINIFVCQFFSFYLDQLNALPYLFINILVYTVVRVAIEQESNLR